MNRLDDRSPVVVGVGAAVRTPEPDSSDLARLDELPEAIELMSAAARQALDDATGSPERARRLARRLGRIAVPQGTWSYPDPGRIIAERLGAGGASTALIGLGIPQQALIDDACADIAAGRLDAVLVVGGEAAQRAVLARRSGIELVDLAQHDAQPDEHRLPDGEIVSRVEIDAGMVAPPVAYALLDSALRASEGRSLDQHRDEIATLWAGFSQVASTNPRAAYPTARTAAWIREPSPENRPVAFPYNKWHCSQLYVDQAAAVLLCSAAVVAELGLPVDRVVVPRVAIESGHAVAVPRRTDLHRWPAMEVLGEVAERHLGRPLADADLIEVYSCFPAAVRIQQRALRLPLDGIPTITGGEPFAGGPWNNFVLQSTVAMIERLRSAPGTTGVVTTVSGFLHKPGLAVYSTEPGPLLTGDLAAEAAAATAVSPLDPAPRGDVRVVACTVTTERDGGHRTVVIAETDDGARCVATSSEPAFAERAMTTELVGSRVEVDGTMLATM